MEKVTPLQAISFTKGSVFIICCWPPSLTANTLQKIKFEVFWYLAFISALLLLLPLLNSVYLDRHDPIILSKSITLVCAVLQINIKMFCCKLQRTRFQTLFLEMERFCKHANRQENEILQSYVNRLKNIHLFYTIFCYFTALAIICGPILLKQPFPTDAKYPFPIDIQPIKSIIYLHQTLVGFQASAAVTVDCQIGLLLWYAAAKFEILTKEFSKAKNKKELHTCLVKYYELLKYATEAIYAARILPLTTIFATSLGVIFSSINIITDQPTTVKLQYVIIMIVASVELFMCAWPADNLISASERISLGAYNSDWYNLDIKSQKNIIHVLRRCQKPAIIKVGGILPSLSLQYYTSFLYKSFSYLAAVRVLFNKNQ